MTRTLATSVAPLLLLVACGGIVVEERHDASMADTGTDGSMADAAPTDDTAVAEAESDSAPTTDAVPPDPGPTSHVDLDVTACVSRPETCSKSCGAPEKCVDEWLSSIIARCPSSECGNVRVKFSRLPDFGGCGQSLDFSVPQPASVVSCLSAELAKQRCSWGLWVGVGDTVDTRTAPLCR